MVDRERKNFSLGRDSLLERKKFKIISLPFDLYTALRISLRIPSVFAGEKSLFYGGDAGDQIGLRCGRTPR